MGPESRILGDAPADPERLRAWHRDCRDFGLRQTAHHELTQALQSDARDLLLRIRDRFDRLSGRPQS
jgi:hypothetical protein